MTNGVQARTTANRVILADLCAGRSDAELATPSLCAGWSCRDVLGHVVMALEVSFPRFLLEVLRDRGRASRTSDRLARSSGSRPTADLVKVLRERSGEALAPPGIGPLGPFADSCIHLRDVAVPLDPDTGRRGGRGGGGCAALGHPRIVAPARGAQPGGQARSRPPRTCRCTWCTLCPAAGPVLATSR